MKRTLIVVVAVVLVLGGVAVAGAMGAWSDGPAAPPGPPVVDASVPDHELLQDALAIDAEWRRGGIAHFAFLPANRPPGLRRLEGIEVPDGVTDLYTGDARILVKYTADPPGRCVPPACLRSGPIGAASGDAPSLHYVTAVTTGGAEPGARAARFWATTAWVPIAQATWFADLVTEARTAAGRH